VPTAAPARPRAIVGGTSGPTEQNGVLVLAVSDADVVFEDGFEL
jgi:hypothetical protein